MAEDMRTEYKREYTDTFVKSVVAFSNTSGGEIIFGISDSGEIIGLRDVDDTAKKCVNAISDKIRPDVSVSTSVDVVNEGGKELVKVNVGEGSKKPYYLREKGLRPEGIYIRKGSSSVQITDEGLYKMIQDIHSASYESLLSIHQDLTFDYSRRIFAEKGIELDDKHMAMMGMTAGGKYTNLGFLFSDQFDQPVKAAKFKGASRSEIEDRAVIEGGILEQLDGMLKFVNAHNRKSTSIGEKYRTDTYEFDPRAIREAVVNAIAHRDYSVESSILLSVYDDRFSITSPGGLFTPMSKEELLDGRSSLRNSKLAAVLYRLEIIEAFGTGIPRIHDIYAGLNVAPDFVFGASSFSITLPAMDNGNGPTINGFLSSKPSFTRMEFQEALGMSKSTATSVINMLIAEGRIKAEGKGRGARYITVQ